MKFSDCWERFKGKSNFSLYYYSQAEDVESWGSRSICEVVTFLWMEQILHHFLNAWSAWSVFSFFFINSSTTHTLPLGKLVVASKYNSSFSFTELGTYFYRYRENNISRINLCPLWHWCITLFKNIPIHLSSTAFTVMWKVHLLSVLQF